MAAIGSTMPRPGGGDWSPCGFDAFGASVVRGRGQCPSGGRHSAARGSLRPLC